MEINNLTTLVRVIKNVDEEEAVKMIQSYGNKRCEDSINRAWARARVIQRFAIKNKREQLKKHILEMDDGSAAISLVEFLRYFASIQDLLREAIDMYDTPEVKDLVDEIEGAMYTKLSNIKLDRRNMFVKD